MTFIDIILLHINKIGVVQYEPSSIKKWLFRFTFLYLTYITDMVILQFIRQQGDHDNP